MFNNIPHTLFVTGTGTDVGKSYATGWLARKLSESGISVITQKFVQTGNNNFSEDIDVHRRLMGIELQPRDLDHTTAPIILSYPASPHLAAAIDKKVVDYNVSLSSIETLANEYDCVISEGAGGLMVPLTEDMLTLDMLDANKQLKPVVVVSGQLGSINHALLTFLALKTKNITPWAVIYNPYFDSDKIISVETRAYLRKYVNANFQDALWLEMES